MSRVTRPLRDYQSKRDFDKTSEPSGIGANKVAPSEHLRFVIQKHDATRMHYDLRLEIGDVFKSWAVTRGPSLDPGEKRLAVEVEDHPLEYGDFEGTIPEGEYGGGTVMLWDRGFWVPETDEPPAKSLQKGELKFAVAGQKLMGGFVLVRLRRKAGDKRNNWLLIKHKDKWATPGKDTIQKRMRSVASGRTMAEIAKGKGNGATPFMTSGNNVSPAAVWDTQASRRSRKTLARRRIERGFSTDVSMPKLTHPDRVLWPGDQPLTKRDLAGYLLDVSPWMIGHLTGRPCSFLRAPDGIAGELFFQRHPMPGQPSSLRHVSVGKEHEAYLQIDDAQSIVAMAQFSAIEFHPWNSAPHEPTVPGRLVFDLDPAPDVAFDTVIEAAHELRALIEETGLVAFCKTTGGKGLHVVAPLVADDAIGWQQAKLFTQIVATVLADRSPGRYVTTMSKRLRKGRIFIDYLRNDVTATAVAPLSPRARPGATVSMPLAWEQVKKGLDPKRFTIRTVPALMKKMKPWKTYEVSARPLRNAIDALGKMK
ncbi:MAG: non-homologous end-joining DNA ligase [Hyphomicrobiaceae bacterium]